MSFTSHPSPGWQVGRPSHLRMPPTWWVEPRAGAPAAGQPAGQVRAHVGGLSPAQLCTPGSSSWTSQLTLRVNPEAVTCSLVAFWGGRAGALPQKARRATCDVWHVTAVPRAGKAHLKRAILGQEEALRLHAVGRALRRVDLLQAVLGQALRRSLTRYSELDLEDDFFEATEAPDIQREQPGPWGQRVGRARSLQLPLQSPPTPHRAAPHPAPGGAGCLGDASTARPCSSAPSIHLILSQGAVTWETGARRRPSAPPTLPGQEPPGAPPRGGRGSAGGAGGSARQARVTCSAVSQGPGRP